LWKTKLTTTTSTNNWAHNNDLPITTVVFVACDNNQLHWTIFHVRASLPQCIVN